MGSIVLSYSPNMSDNCFRPAFNWSVRNGFLSGHPPLRYFPTLKLGRKFFFFLCRNPERSNDRSVALHQSRERELCRGTLSREATSASSDVPNRWRMERHTGAERCIYRKEKFITGLSSGIWSLPIVLHFKLISAWWSAWGWFPSQWKLIKAL